MVVGIECVTPHVLHHSFGSVAGDMGFAFGLSGLRAPKPMSATGTHCGLPNLPRCMTSALSSGLRWRHFDLPESVASAHLKSDWN